MGGYGSGTWSRWHTHATADRCLDVDVRYLQRRGWLRAGGFFSLSWARGGTPAGNIRVCVTSSHVELVYRVQVNVGDWEDVRERVALAWTPCHFGGRRAWFRCPGMANGRPCGRRVAKLYECGCYFFCRHCCDLRYQSQRESPADRAREKAQAIRRRLGGTGSLLDLFPERPKGMHWRTYERLREQAMAGEAVWDAASWDWLARTSAVLDRLAARR